MKVCMCRRTNTSYHPKIWHGPISPISTKLGGDPKFRPPGVPLIVTLSEIPTRLRILRGLEKKLILGVGLPGENLFLEGSP